MEVSMTATPTSLPIVFVASIPAGLLWSLPTRWLTGYLYRQYYALPGSKEAMDPFGLHDQVRTFGMLVGIFERFVYAASWLLGVPQAIAVILALKATPSLKEW